MALLLTPNGFQLYLHADSRFRHRSAATIGVQYLMWARDSQSDLEQITQRLRAYDVAAFSYTQGGVTFVEGCDPDRERVIIAYPSPRQLPREVIAQRLHS
ncbi:MAG TPA: VOC family protein [Mycobacterium sp.]|nr:VOC family protein [Mycobacterium sp.]